MLRALRFFVAARFAVVGLALTLAACAGQASAPAQDSGLTRPPTRIVLRDLSIDPQSVQLDEATLAARGRAPSAESVDSFRQTDAETARDMIATTLVFRLKQLGFSVERAPPTETPPAAALVIDGKLDRVDEGNGARRRADPDHGRALVAGQIQLLAVRGDGQPTEIAAFADGSDAHRPPGLPGATAAEAAALAVGGIRARELLQASISAESRRLGNAFADQIKDLLVQKGWLPDGA